MKSHADLPSGRQEFALMRASNAHVRAESILEPPDFSLRNERSRMWSVEEDAMWNRSAMMTRSPFGRPGCPWSRPRLPSRTSSAKPGSSTRPCSWQPLRILPGLGCARRQEAAARRNGRVPDAPAHHLNCKHVCDSTGGRHGRINFGNHAGSDRSDHGCHPRDGALPT